MSAGATLMRTPRLPGLLLGLTIVLVATSCLRDDDEAQTHASNEQGRLQGIVDTSRLGDSERSIVDRLHYDARFVTGDQLEVLDELLGRASGLTKVAAEREIYLLLRIEARESLTFKKVLRASFELSSPLPLTGVRFGVAGSLYRDDGIYSIEKVVSAGNVMTDASRQEILAATPRLVMTDVYLK